MRLLADENVHPVVIERLRLAGIDVEAIAETMRSASDEAILARPDIADKVLLTYDSDFGALIFERGLPRPRAIIYSRLGRAEPRYIADRILQLVDAGLPDHQIITITLEKDRMTPFPDGA